MQRPPWLLDSAHQSQDFAVADLNLLAYFYKTSVTLSLLIYSVKNVHSFIGPFGQLLNINSCQCLNRGNAKSALVRLLALVLLPAPRPHSSSLGLVWFCVVGGIK